MERPDPFDLLATFAPPASPLKPGDDPIADKTLERILSGATVTPITQRAAVRGRRRRWIVPMAVAGMVCVGGVAAAAVLTRRQPVDPTQLACLRTATVGSDAYVVELDPTLSLRDQCAPGWFDGTFGTDGPPEFTGCVDTEGYAFAVPDVSDEVVCSGLGYVDYDPAPDPEADTIRAVTDQVASLNDADPDRCIEMDEAVVVYRELLDRNGFTDWAFTTDGYVYSDSNPCIQLAFVREQRLIGLPGVPKPG